MPEMIEEQKQWFIETECDGRGNGDGGCGTRWKINRDDIFMWSQSSMGRWTTKYLIFRCPACSALNDLDSNDTTRRLPDFIWGTAKQGVKHTDGRVCHPDDPGAVKPEGD